MVIVHLMGGLGNQLFQYATARRIAEVNQDILKLDISSYERKRLRKYELYHFKIFEEFASRKEITRLKGGDLNSLFNHFRKRPFYPQSFIEEHDYRFDPAILRLRGDIYLKGYWQSEKYFEDIKQILYKEFTIKTEPDQIAKKMSEKITSSNSVSLHIRRGDYVTNKVTNQIHGTCSLNYYLIAIAKLTQTIKEPHFFVFSDDLDWARQNLRIDFPVTFMADNGPAKAYEDLRLMSLCKHHIIANSSFSWWGAWLCQNSEKIVFAPREWFQTSNLNTQDLIPEKWIKI